jgi:glutaredoxin
MVSPLKKQIGLLKKRKKSDGNKKNNKKSKLVSSQKSKKNAKKNNVKKSTEGKKRKRRVVDGNYTIKKKSLTENNQKWKLYSMEGCPYCKSAKELLESKKIDFDYIVFENLPPEEQKKVEADMDKQKLAKIKNPNDAQNYKENPFRTFPRIFKSDGVFIGGYNDTRLYFEKN